MKFNEVQKMALKYGIKSVGKTKVNLIREIQVAEGNQDCFGTAIDYCDQLDCCFYAICLDSNKAKTSTRHRAIKSCA